MSNVPALTSLSTPGRSVQAAVAGGCTIKKLKIKKRMIGKKEGFMFEF
jgi:hypothetical protein